MIALLNKTRYLRFIPDVNLRSFAFARFDIERSLYLNAIPDDVPKFSSLILATIEFWKIKRSNLLIRFSCVASAFGFDMKSTTIPSPLPSIDSKLIVRLSRMCTKSDSSNLGPKIFK